MDEELLDRVKAFVSHRLAVSLEKLSPETRIREDIGCDGDDAEDFLLAFAKEFGVDLAGFRIERHFHPEHLLGCSPLVWVAWPSRTLSMKEPINGF